MSLCSDSSHRSLTSSTIDDSINSKDCFVTNISNSNIIRDGHSGSNERQLCQDLRYDSMVMLQFNHNHASASSTSINSSDISSSGKNQSTATNDSSVATTKIRKGLKTPFRSPLTMKPRLLTKAAAFLTGKPGLPPRLNLQR